MMAWLKGWRTALFNGLVAAGVVLGEILQFAVGFNWESIVSARQAAYVVLGINIANILLRAVTTTPIGKAI
jgi:hypothetical protein